MSKIRWFTDISRVEMDAVAQVERTASMPFVEGVAVMPDVHFGRSSTVGTVVATRDAVIPACVGVDIGCGMIAVRTTLTPGSVLPLLRKIREGIERRIPLGIGLRGQNSRLLPSAEVRIAVLESEALLRWGDVNYMDARAGDWRNQLGSLGGGNHFIEVCVGNPMTRSDVSAGGLLEYVDLVDDSVEEVWVILHSGSRGVGNKTGTFWTKQAQKLAAKYKFDGWLPDPDLAYLPVSTDEYHAYMSELFWCQEFACSNREEMMDRVLAELTHTLALDLDPVHSAIGIEVERINCHHNYVSRENHDGKNVLVTRKGAIRAKEGDRGLIPGSMGARSYIVSGLGHPGAYESAPHGAGRRMSRSAARKQFTVEGVRAAMEAQGIEANVREAIVDEAPGAYKDIDVVMHDARALVKPTHVLRQVVSVKGN